MWRLFKRSSKLVNERASDTTDHQSSSIVNPIDKRELLTRYVGIGKPKEPLSVILEKNNIGKYCRVTLQEKCLIVTELTDVEVVRISGNNIRQCLQEGTNKKLRNCVAITVGQDDAYSVCHLFETCSVKEVIYLCL